MPKKNAFMANRGGGSRSATGVLSFLLINPTTTSPANPPLATPTTAPDLATASDTGTSDTDNITGVLSPQFTGSGATPGATVTLYIDGVANGTTTAAGDGSWSYVPATPLTPGNYSVAWTQGPGESGQSPALAITIVDTTAPAAAPNMTAATDLGASDTDNITSDATPTFNDGGTLATAGGTVTVYADGVAIGTATVAGDGTWSVTPATDLALGDYDITYTTTGAGGLESAASPALAITIEAAPLAVEAPTIGTPVITLQALDILDIQWPITMAATGGAASNLEVNIYHSVDAFAAPVQAAQNITTGIGLGAVLNVDWAGLGAMNGVTPVTYRVTAEAT